MMKNFYYFLKFLLIFILVYFLFDPVLRYAALAAAATEMGGGYNIIFILTDQERHFAEYPAESNFRARERLKNIGVSFEKHYICSTMSTSSRSVIYTGKHITDTKMFDNTNLDYQSSLSTDMTTIGDMARELGYYTAYKGKFHIINNADLSKFNNSLEKYGFSDWDGENMGNPNEGHDADPDISSYAVHWLREKGASLNKDGTPFFLAVNFINPHDIMYFNTDAPGVQEQDTGHLLFPINRAPETPLYQKTYPNSPLPSTWNQGFDSQIAAHAEYRVAWGANTGIVPNRKENWERFRDYYYNTIQDNDNQLLKVLDEVEKLRMMDKTIIIFTSDHGEQQGANSLNGKGNAVYENNVHVPLIIHHPDVAGGAKISALTSHLDLAPTIVNMAGGSPNGHSLLPLLKGEKTEVREDALFACSLLSVIDSRFSYFQPSATPMLETQNRGVVRGLITADGYKFARYFKPYGFNTPQTLQELFARNDVEIFDMNNDPEERENLAQKLRENEPEFVMKLNSRLNKIISDEIGVDDGKEFENVLPVRPRSSGGCNSGFFPLVSLGLLFLFFKK